MEKQTLAPKPSSYLLNGAMAIDDTALVKTAAWCSLISYYPEDEIKELAEKELKIDSNNVAYYNINARKTNTDFYVLNTEDCIVVAFSGSKPSSFKDWITTDFDHDLTSAFGMGHADIKVHSGFLNALNSCWSTLIVELTQRWRLVSKKSGSHPMVLITGHSLGGALANLTAATIARHIEENSDRSSKQLSGILDAIKVQTFGQPRIGDSKFCAWYNQNQSLSKNTLRHINHHDLVPRLPPKERMVWFRFFDPGWEHVGQQWVYEHNGCVDKVSTNKDFPDLFFGNIPKPIALTCSVIDHMPWRYLWAVEGLEGEPNMHRRLEEALFFSRFAMTAVGRLVSSKLSVLVDASRYLLHKNESRS